ncbi:MAG: tRNA (adenosine(37)-N6)-threonylcarbamoyltransferase complex ATPase subunit type 1 TsaE [Pseudomonadota bacterium]
MTNTPNRLTIFCANVADTERFAESLALSLQAGDFVALLGPVGAGKSTLARALIRTALGNREAEVPSPTFTLVQTYEDAQPVALLHADFYRLSAPEDAEELGLEEALNTGAVLAEWPQHVPDLLARATFSITLIDGQAEDETRRIEIEAPADALNRLMRSLAIRQFLDGVDYGSHARIPLTGDASSRAYETIVPDFDQDLQDRPRRILMNAPAQADGPPLRDGKPYSKLAHLAEDIRPFIAISGLLESRGFRVPQCLAADLDAGLLLTSHLGAGTILNADGSPIFERYSAAVDVLAALSRQDWPGATPVQIAGQILAEDHVIPTYDAAALGIEVELFCDWYVGQARGETLAAADKETFVALWAALFERLERVPKTLSLRDFHSPNLLWAGENTNDKTVENTGLQRVGLIDFQDAVLGPLPYDLASLAQDARVTISEPMEQALVERFLEQANVEDTAAFHEAYAIMAAQRATKILGIFVRLSKRDGKDQYLAHLPRIEAYLARTLRHPILSDLRGWLRSMGMF